MENNVFLKGYKAGIAKGIKIGIVDFKKKLWKDVNKNLPKEKEPILIKFDNNIVKAGTFEGWGFKYSIEEENFNHNIIAWCYIKDLFYKKNNKKENGNNNSKRKNRDKKSNK